MGRRRSRFLIREIYSLSLLLTLLVQFAPSIHALSPHDETSTSDSCSATAPQVEAPRSDKDSCRLCTLLLNRQAPTLPFNSNIGVLIALRSVTPPLPALSEHSDCELADSRGPPFAL